MKVLQVLEFFKQVNQEMGRVAWPSQKETLTTSVVVFIAVAVAALFFLVVDFGIYHFVQFFINI